MTEPRVGVVVKTAVGGMWILPQVHALRARGATVTVIIPPGQGRLATHLEELTRVDPGVELVRSEFDFRFGPRPSTLSGLVRFRRQLRALHLDAVLYHLYASALAVRLSTVGTGIRRVHMVAGPLYLDSRVIRTAERVLARLDHVLIGGSRYTAERYRALGYPARRLRALPYGVDLARFTPGTSEQSRAERLKLDLPAEAFVVIMVAYVYAPKQLTHAGVGIKGHDTLIAAWRSFASTHRDARLLLVGSGFDDAGEEHRRRLIEDLGVSLESIGITWLETVDDVRGAYSASDLSVSPSISDNHGAVLEASACGVPSIVSDAGALPETVDVGSTGWMFAAGDAAVLEDRLDDAYSAWREGVIADMGRAARAKAEREFSNTVSADAVADLVIEGIAAT